jgi:hypothetical protein
VRKILFVLFLAAAGLVSASDGPDDDKADRPDPGEQAKYIEFLLHVVKTDGDTLSDLALSRKSKFYIDDSASAEHRLELQLHAERLLERMRAADDDKEVLSLRLVAGELPEAGSVERAELLQKGEAVAAENAFVAVTLLNLPEYSDPALAASLLHRAAKALRYQSLYVAVARSLNTRILSTVRTHGMPQFLHSEGMSPETFAFVFALGYNSAIALPGYRKFLDLCGDTAFDQLRADCRNVAALMAAQADTVIDVAIANATLKRLAEGPVERAEAMARRRQSAWIQESAALLSSQIMPEDGEPWTPEMNAEVQRFARTWLADGEVAAFLQQTRDAGISEHPPEDWRPEFEQGAPAEK